MVVSPGGLSSARSTSQNARVPAQRFLAYAMVLLATLAAFGQVVSFRFTGLDDQVYVTENPNVLSGLTPSGLAWAFTTLRGSNWHPLTWLSLMIDAQFGGGSPAVYHASNLALHAVNALLLLNLLDRATGRLWRSAFVAALFAIHPLHVESIAWIAERKDVLSTLFLLLALIAYVRYVERPGRIRYITVAAAFTLGLMAKPMLVTFPLLLLLFDFWPLGRWRLSLENDNGLLSNPSGGPRLRTREPREGSSVSSRGGQHGKQDRSLSAAQRSHASAAPVDLVREKLPLLVLSAASCVITLVAQHCGGAILPLERFPLLLRIQNALLSYGLYLGEMVWPKGLAAPYPPPESSIPLWKVLLCAAILSAITYLALKAIGRYPYVAVGWFWYLISLVPVIGLVQVGTQSMADRYTYVPLIGPFIVIAWGIPDLSTAVARRRAAGTTGRSEPERSRTVSHRGARGHASPGEAPMQAVAPGKSGRSTRPLQDRFVLPAAAVAVILALMAVSFAQAQHWRDRIALFSHLARVRPDHAFGHNILGATLCQNGRFEEGLRELEEAVRLDPRYVDVRNNLGIALFQSGKTGEALVQFREAVRLDPGFTVARDNLERALAVEHGRTHEAPVGRPPAEP